MKTKSILLILILSVYSIFLKAQIFNSLNPIFETFSKDQGVLHSRILCITQDNEGYLWFGTYGGLHRFDGSTFDYFLHEDSLSESIADNNIYSIFQDSKKRIWIGTENGLSLYLPETNGFKNFNDPSFGFKNFGLRHITEDKNGLLWIASYGGGVGTFDPEKGKLIKWYTKENNGISNNFVNTIFCDRHGSIWAGLESKGIVCYHSNSSAFKTIAPEISNQTINSIKEDKTGTFWIGTWVGGLFSYNPLTKSIKQYNYIASDKNSVSDPTIRQIDIDKNGLLWLSTANGLGCFDPKKEQCITFRNNISNGKSISFNFLWSVFVDKDNIVWIGTFGNGLSKLDPNRNRFIIQDLHLPSCEVNYNNVEFVSSDSFGRLWVAPKEGGIYVYNQGKECIFKEELVHQFLNQKIRCFYEGKDNYVWLGTEDGIIRCTKNLKEFTSISFRNGLNGLSIFGINEDSKGNILFGGWNTGLLILPSTKKGLKTISMDELIVYSRNSKDEKRIPSDVIWDIYKDSNQRLWIAMENSVGLYNEQQNNVTIYIDSIINIAGFAEFPAGTIWASNNGVGLTKMEYNKKPINFPLLNTKKDKMFVYGMIVKDSLLWIGAENGLFSFNPKSLTTKQYTSLDGLPSTTFERRSASILLDGSILMGTSNGLIKFFPKNLTTRYQDPLIRINDIRLFNKSISKEHSDYPLLKKSLSAINEVEFNYDQNVFSISFSAVEFSMPKKLRFAYKLEGFHKNWQEAEVHSRVATFTNLDPGTYIFKVKTILENGNYGTKETTIKIKILPPWWKTWWFNLLLYSFLIGIMFSIYFVRTRAIKKRTLWLQNQVALRTQELSASNKALEEQNVEINTKTAIILEQQKDLLDKKYFLEKNNDKLSEWNEFQQKLIGIIAHDIRGPLQRFSSLLRFINEEDSKEFVTEKLVETSSNLSLLATDLVNWVSLQSSKSEIQNESFLWKEVLEKVIKELKGFSEDKRITFSVTYLNEQTVEGNLQIVQASIRNLLVNAIKFSALDGIIELEAGIIKNGKSSIRITDYGKGFSASEINKLINGDGFKGIKSVSLNEGAGLGLTLCNDMLKRIDGKIEAFSLPGSGATFFVELPLSKNEPATIKKNSNAVVKKEIVFKTSFLNGKTILLVEDDDEIRWALVKYLNQYVDIYEARTAEEAIGWLKENTPDLALMDVNMSGISGIELCKRIKGAAETAHVPCLIITGELNDTIRREAFNAGADVFMLKPFTPEEITLQLISYFENQEKQLKRFFFETMPVEEFTENPINRAFLNKLLDVIDKNISSSELNVDLLTKELGMSRSTLYRNLKGLTGQSANGFIKNIRMKKSLQLLKESRLNISEISTELGFGSASYFTTAFKKHFGFSPNEIQKG